MKGPQNKEAASSKHHHSTHSTDQQTVNSTNKCKGPDESKNQINNKKENEVKKQKQRQITKRSERMKQTLNSAHLFLHLGLHFAQGASFFLDLLQPLLHVLQFLRA
ncbi:hypothetical protein CR513_16750, partial [Mucuna pruriens]